MRVLSVDEFDGPESNFGCCGSCRGLASRLQGHGRIPPYRSASSCRCRGGEYQPRNMDLSAWSEHFGDTRQICSKVTGRRHRQSAVTVQGRSSHQRHNQDHAPWGERRQKAKVPVNAVYKNTIKMRYRTNSVLHRSLRANARRTSAARDVDPNCSHAKASQCYPVCADMPGASLPMPPPGRPSMQQSPDSSLCSTDCSPILSCGEWSLRRRPCTNPPGDPPCTPPPSRPGAPFPESC